MSSCRLLTLAILGIGRCSFCGKEMELLSLDLIDYALHDRDGGMLVAQHKLEYAEDKRKNVAGPRPSSIIKQQDHLSSPLLVHA